jgi:hypothetical protein
MRSGFAIDKGKIAKPEAVNDRDVNPAGTTFSVTREGTAQVGDAIYLIGRTSGWLTGVITDMCTVAGVPGAHDDMVVLAMTVAMSTPRDSFSRNIARTRFVIAGSTATRRSRSRGGVPYPDAIAVFRAQ